MIEQKRKSVCIITNTPLEFELMCEALKEEFLFTITTHAKKSLEVIDTNGCEVILLDTNIQDIEWEHYIKSYRLNKGEKALPIVVVSSQKSNIIESNSLKLEVADFIVKPLSLEIVSLRLSRVIKKIEQDKNFSQLLALHNHELEAVQNNLIKTLNLVAEARGPESKEHLMRVKSICAVVARELSNHPNYEKVITPRYIKYLYELATMHDIGFLLLPDYVIDKVGKESLNEMEFEILKKHTLLGSKIIRDISEGVEDNLFLDIAEELALYHHESWDGSGYPNGLKGDDIPISAQILHIAEYYDLVTHKERLCDIAAVKSIQSLEHSEALEKIKALRGKIFSPILVDFFLEIGNILEKIEKEYPSKEKI